MNTKLLTTMVALAMAMPATAAADVCKDIESGDGKVAIEKAVTTEGCTANLTKDTIIKGSGVGKIVAGKHGVIIKLNGHKLTVRDLPVHFSGDFAIAIHGKNDAADVVEFDNVVLKDLKSMDCGDAARTRVGAVVWKVKSANLDLTAMNVRVRHGVVVGAPMPEGDEHPSPKAQGTAKVSGPIAYCPGKWNHGKTAVLAFERAVSWTGGVVESVGPCDFEDPTLVNLRDLGLPNK